MRELRNNKSTEPIETVFKILGATSLAFLGASGLSWVFLWHCKGCGLQVRAGRVTSEAGGSMRGTSEHVSAHQRTSANSWHRRERPQRIEKESTARAGAGLATIQEVSVRRGGAAGERKGSARRANTAKQLPTTISAYVTAAKTEPSRAETSLRYLSHPPPYGRYSL